MPESPLLTNGAQIQPSNAAPLHTNEFFTGEWTQGNPLGPGAVPYLYQKFYAASRYDRLVGGSNMEISVKLTLRRRFGNSVLNGTPVTQAKRFYQFRAFNAVGANNRLLADEGTTVDDVTPGTGDTVLFNKTAGAGRTCFQGVGNTCYFSDGIDQEKYMQAGKSWAATTIFSAGDLIIDPNGNVQVVESMFTLNIVAIQIVTTGGTNFYAIVTFDTPIAWTVGTNIKFTGSQVYLGLNGSTLATIAGGPFLANANQAVVQLPVATTNAIYGPAGDVGSATSQVGTPQGQSGGAPPAWNVTLGNYTNDGNLVWRNFSKPVYPWSPPAPTAAPTRTAQNGIRQWLPSQLYANASASLFYFSILDFNNNIEVLPVAAHSQVGPTGPTVPNWSQIVPSATSSGGKTPDGFVTWQNCGPVLAWIATTVYYTNQCILDSNGNLQIVTAGGGGASGAAAPAWNTIVGGTTPGDGALTWTNVGSGFTLFTATRQYSFSYHTISGQVTTSSPQISLNPTGFVVGDNGAVYARLDGPVIAQNDIDQIWIWATAQGGTVPLLLGKIPNPTPGAATTWTFYDEFPDSILNELISGPIAHQNDPPPKGFVPAGYHLGLILGFVNNVVYYSNGPNTTVGNGNESFPPNNNFQLPSIAVAGWSTSIGFVILRVDGISIMLGSRTASSPLYVVNIFDSVGLASRDGFSTRGNRIFMMTTTGKLITMDTSQFIAAIEGQVSQALADLEVGFPIGDLLQAFTPANCYVAWHEGPSGDSGLFVADGATGWHMMRQLTQPEQCTPWSPKANITGGIGAILSIQTAPGVNSLIMATPGGPIWKRDPSANTDAGTPFAMSGETAAIVLAQPGTEVGAQFVATEEVATLGANCTTSVLFDEIATSATKPWLPLVNITNEPPNLPPQVSLGVQRSWISQSPDTIQKCRYMKILFSWPAQDDPNELLTFTVYGRLPEKARK